MRGVKPLHRQIILGNTVNSPISHSTQFAAHACPVRRRKGVLRSAGIVLTDQRICRSPDNPPEMCHLLELVCRLHCTRPVRVYRTKADGRREFPTDQRVLVHGAVVTVQLLLYHVCNRFARLSGRFSPNFCISAQFFVWKSVAFLRISEGTEQDSPIQIVTFSEILSYFRLTKQKKSGGCRTGKTIFCKKWSYCR